MTIAVRAITAPSSDISSPYTVNKPTGTLQGDLMIASVLVTAEAVDQIQPPAGWYAVIGGGINGEDNISTWYKVAGASEPSSYDFTSIVAANSGIGIISLYSDIASPLTIADVASQINASGDRVCPDVTFPAAGLFVGFVACKSSLGATAPGGATEEWDTTLSGNRSGCYTGAVAVAGDYGLTATGSSAISKCISLAIVEGATTYPGIRYRTNANTGPTNSAGSLGVTMPATIVAGDMLIAHLTLDSDTTVTTPAGWTLQATLATTGALRIFSKLADGSEAGVTLTVSFTGTLTASLAVSVFYSPSGDNLTVGQVATASTGAASSITFPTVTSTQAGSVLVMLTSKAQTTQYQLTNEIDMWKRYDFGGTSIRTSMFSEYLLTTGATGTRVAEPTSGSHAADMVSLLIEIDPPDTDPPVVYATAYGPHGIMVSLTYDGDDNPEDWIWQWSANGATGWTTLGTTDVAVAYWRHHPLTPATTYYYRAAVYVDSSAGAWSAVVSATTHSLVEVADGVALWIDVRDSSNNKLGPGPLTEVVRWANVRRLSRAGEFSVEFPATYARLHQIQSDSNPLLNTDRYLYCYGILDGVLTLIGAGWVKEIQLTRNAGGAPSIVASGPDLMGELRKTTVYDQARPYQYALENSATAPSDLMGDFAITPFMPANWTLTGGAPTFYAVTAKFVHATLLGALIDVGNKIGEYFRLGSSNNGRELVWIGPPVNFADCGVRAELSVDPLAAEGNDEICLITNIQEIQDSWDLYTKVFAFGAGQGHDRMDLAAVTFWPDEHRLRSTITSISGDGVTVSVTTATDHELTVGEDIEIVGTGYDGTRTVATTPTSTTFTFLNATTGAETTGYVYGDYFRDLDGEEFFFNRLESSLENRDARTAYGRNHTAIQFKEIGPITNSDSDISAAANSLLAAAYNWLRQHDAPAKFYNLSVAKLNSIIYPGQLIRTVAKGFVEGSAYLNINTNLTILEVRSEVGGGGVRTTGLVVSTVERWPSSDGDQAAQEFHQAEIYQSLAQLGPTVDTISYRESIDDDTGATFYFFLGEETVAVNSVLIRFRADKLRSTVKSIGGSSATTTSGGSSTPTTTSGGGSTPTSASGGGATETTDSGSGHTHEIDLADSTSGTPVYFAGVGSPPEGDLRTSGGGKINASATDSGHTHDVTVPAHTHDVTIPSHTHDVTVPAHTHDVTAAITTAYGIYEDPGTAYAATDLEFSINGGAWRSDYSAISGASGWYGLDITSEITGVALRPLRVANSVAVRVIVANESGKKVQITAQIERRCVIQSIAQF